MERVALASGVKDASRMLANRRKDAGAPEPALLELALFISALQHD